MNQKGMIMKSSIATFFTMAAVTALALVLAPAAKAVDLGCSNTSLRGSFAYTETGSLVAAPAPIGPYAEVGVQTFDGNGNTTVTGMSSTNGTASPADQTGTYTVNSDCTGTFMLQIAPGVTVHFFFAISNDGNLFQALCLDPVAVITRLGRRRFPGREI
jgi:hypothetical protein